MSKEAMKLALEKIANVNAMDYEYQAWAREALAEPDFWEGYVPEPTMYLESGGLGYGPAPERKLIIGYVNKSEQPVKPATEQSSAVQPEKETVAWGVFDGPNLHDMFFTEQDAQDMARLKGDGSVVKPLCTTTPKRQWAGLTVEEMNEMTWGKTIYEILELAEAKLKEKNNGN